MNFNEYRNRGKTYGSTRGRNNSSSNASGNNRLRGPTDIRGGSIGSRPIPNERSMRDANSTRSSDSTNWNHSNQGRSRPNDSDRRKIPEPQTTDIDNQMGHSRNATSMATAFEPLNRSLELFLTRMSRTSERSEKSRRELKKPRRYKDESDSCIDT